MSLPRYAAGRLLLGLGQVAGITTIVFVLTEALPGDAAVVIAATIPTRPASPRFGRNWTSTSRPGSATSTG